ATGDNNQLQSDGVYNYEYDDEGNRTRRITLVSGNPTGATTVYSYDHRNRQTRVVEKDSPSGTITKQTDYTYDAFNRRIAKPIDTKGGTSGGVTEQYFVYDGQNIQLALEADGDIIHRYLYGNAVDQLFSAEAANGDVLWGLTDDQNTPRDIAEYNVGTDSTTI